MVRKTWTWTLLVVCVAAGPASAALVVEAVSDADPAPNVYNSVEWYYRVTSPGMWEALVDGDTGAIFSFKDLTDSRYNDSGYEYGHVNLVG